MNGNGNSDHYLSTGIQLPIIIFQIYVPFCYQ